jgi:peptidoglycan lytic transglycosylase
MLTRILATLTVAFALFFAPLQRSLPLLSAAASGGDPVVQTLVGLASYYGPGFHGRPTASGEVFNMYELVAAHRTLPLGTVARVTNLRNGRSVVVRINDRGPYIRGRILDLSKEAARALAFVRDGTARVRIEILKRRTIEWRHANSRGAGRPSVAPALTRGPRG